MSKMEMSGREGVKLIPSVVKALKAAKTTWPELLNILEYGPRNVRTEFEEFLDRIFRHIDKQGEEKSFTEDDFVNYSTIFKPKNDLTKNAVDKVITLINWKKKNQLKLDDKSLKAAKETMSAAGNKEPDPLWTDLYKIMRGSGEGDGAGQDNGNAGRAPGAAPAAAAAPITINNYNNNGDNNTNNNGSPNPATPGASPAGPAEEEAEAGESIFKRATAEVSEEIDDEGRARAEAGEEIDGLHIMAHALRSCGSLYGKDRIGDIADDEAAAEHDFSAYGDLGTHRMGDASKFKADGKYSISGKTIHEDMRTGADTNLLARITLGHKAKDEIDGDISNSVTRAMLDYMVQEVEEPEKFDLSFKTKTAKGLDNFIKAFAEMKYAKEWANNPNPAEEAAPDFCKSAHPASDRVESVWIDDVEIKAGAFLFANQVGIAQYVKDEKARRSAAAQAKEEYVPLDFAAEFAKHADWSRS